MKFNRFFKNFRMQRKQMIDSGEKLSWTEPDKAWLEPIDSANNGNYFRGLDLDLDNRK